MKEPYHQFVESTKQSGNILCYLGIPMVPPLANILMRCKPFLELEGRPPCPVVELNSILKRFCSLMLCQVPPQLTGPLCIYDGFCFCILWHFCVCKCRYVCLSVCVSWALSFFFCLSYFCLFLFCLILFYYYYC